ncbi:hypothetical protein E2K93_11445 [Thalassotalea sp. HSM 43]|uniref:MAPEG family protein n=1 Tax=Thalassotalea sp. HSM 43 TaxID=2552945 RepID=UPI0010810A43|nr:MAPEG family protein [Thalassotalea sp. HSM 43]QBY04959.1 hypothetical protein E2K93_11445 [Thalassotalea sp. HSM 43]
MTSNIILPVLALLLLTIIVWLYMYYKRLSYLFKHNIDAQDLVSPEQLKAIIPETVNRPANNLANLFEMPVLFYVLMLLAMQQQFDKPIFIALAWGFVGCRAIHSLIHCSYNRVMHRFACYFLASLCLIGQFVLFALEILT